MAFYSASGKGKRADLSFTNLSQIDLSQVNLAYANLSNAYLSEANLSQANLRNANLSNAILSDANLSDVNLSNANLSNATLLGAQLTGAVLNNIRSGKNCYQVSGVGRVGRLVSYFLKEDTIVCGCWECKQGNTLKNFEKRVKLVYGKNGNRPNNRFYQEYMEAIKFFKRMKKLLPQ